MKINTSLILNSNQNTKSSIEFSDASFLESAFNKHYQNFNSIFSDGPTIDIELGSVESGLRIESISTTYSFAPGISMSSELATYQNASIINNLYNSNNNSSADSGSSDDSVKDGLVITINPDGTITKKPLSSNSQTDTNLNTPNNDTKLDLSPSKVNYSGVSTDRFDETKAKPSKAEVFAMIEEIAPKYDMDPSLVKAIVETESTFNHQCISRSGAVGLMQLMPVTAREMGLTVNNTVDERWDPRKNIEAGIKYISKYHKIISKHFGKEDWNLTLAAYNAGPNRVIREGGIPNIPETKNYVVKVNKFLEKYK